MKKFFNVVALAAILVSLNSCGTTAPVIRGTYAPVNAATSELEYEKVWEKVIDFFAENSIPVGVLDKTSGLISAKEIKFDNDLVTYEDVNGKMVNPNAWFVVSYGKNVVGARADCSFNIRVKKLDEGGTSIQINLSNIVGYYDVEWYNIEWLRKEIAKTTYPRECRSTGKFEEALLNYLK